MGTTFIPFVYITISYLHHSICAYCSNVRNTQISVYTHDLLPPRSRFTYNMSGVRNNIFCLIELINCRINNVN